MTTAIKTIPIRLEITSDSICPFCFVGFRRIQSAIAQAKKENLPLGFSISFARTSVSQATVTSLLTEPATAYLLDPTLPASPGENKRARYIAKFGGVEKVKAMEEAMIERGKGEGINFSYGGNVSQTTDSHRLIEKAKEVGGEAMQLAIVERLFKSYFEEEADPGAHDLLARDAETVGLMSKSEALTFLASDELKPEVAAGILKAQRRGISGVPFTIVNEEFGISGAQETSTFLEIFKKIAAGDIKVQGETK